MLMESLVNFFRNMNIDALIEKYFAPFSDKFSSLVFTPISILGNEIPFLLLLMIVASIVCTFYFRWIGIWGFKHSLKQIFHKSEDSSDKGEVSPIGALATALSGTVGLGNIAGVAIAISIGGPGAMFWMCLGAIFGMALKFCEVSLSLKYRIFNEDGTMLIKGSQSETEGTFSVVEWKEDGSLLLTLVFGSDTMEFNYEFLSDGVTVQLCRPGTDIIHTWIKK